MKKLLNYSEWPTATVLTVSFLVVAAIGGMLLSLPFFHQPAIDASFFDHFITAVSLVCVSGIAALPIGETYNIFGQAIALLIIQIGGLGVITIINTGLFYLNQQLSLKNQYLIQASLNRDTNTNLFDFLFSIYRLTLTVELLGTLIIMTNFVPEFGWLQGSFNSLFLAVSAFNNSGVDNIGVATIQTFNSSPLITLTVASLVIIGGLGFSVWFEIITRFKKFIKEKPHHLGLAFNRLSTHTRLVLQMTAILLITGTLLIWAVESQNPATIAGRPWSEQLLASFFKSASTRSAGYITFSYEYSQPFTKLLFMLFAIIGGAPGGTAGGLKVTTVAILALLFKSELAGHTKVTYNHRVIPNKLVKQAVMITLFFFFLAMGGYGLLLITHPQVSAMDMMFETFSAMGTLGVSMNVTHQLNIFGRVIIIILTLAGRVGPITILLAVLQKQTKEIYYAETNILLG